MWWCFLPYLLQAQQWWNSNDVKCLARQIAWLFWSPHVLMPARSLHSSDRPSPMKAYPSITLAIKAGQVQAYKYPLLTPRKDRITYPRNVWVFRLTLCMASICFWALMGPCEFGYIGIYVIKDIMELTNWKLSWSSYP